jgi:hypothetical protein
MSAEGVQALLYHVIKGIKSPYANEPINVFIEGPVPGHLDITSPIVYVRAAGWRNYRDSLPRGNPGQARGTFVQGSAGWKVRRYRATLTVYVALTNPTPPPPADPRFPLSDPARYGKRTTTNRNLAMSTVQALIEHALMTTKMPEKIQDPSTGYLSTVMDVGESLTWSVPVAATLADQALMRYLSEATLDLVEMFNA